jgi:hypothetical protein
MAAFCLLAKVTPFVGAAQVVARGQIPPLETTPDYSLSIDANGHRWAGAKRERRGPSGWRAVALNDVVDAARRGGGEAAAAQQLPRACVSQTGAPWR